MGSPLTSSIPVRRAWCRATIVASPRRNAVTFKLPRELPRAERIEQCCSRVELLKEPESFLGKREGNRRGRVTRWESVRVPVTARFQQALFKKGALSRVKPRNPFREFGAHSN